MACRWLPPLRIWLWLFIPLLPLAFHLDKFAYPQGSPFSDVLISHYPNFLYLRQSIALWRTIPLWSPLIFSGYPFFANPQSGLWYLPGWLGVILPLPLAFNLLTLMHLLWGGVGFYILARTQGLGEEGALLSALGWELMPKVMAHYGAGHITLVYSLSWTPWLLAAEILKPGWIPLILALSFLAAPQWAGYAFTLWLLWSFCRAFEKKGLRCIPFWALKVAWNLSIAALLTAPLLIPLLEYTSLSTRAHLLPSDIFTYSLTPATLLTFFFPAFGSFHEVFIYPRAVVMVLAVSGGLSRFWWAVALLGVIWALGENVPGAYLIASLPGVSFVRVPSRGVFLTLMALAFLAGEGLENFQVGLKDNALKRARLSLVALPAASFMLALGLKAIGNRVAPLAFWGAIAFALASFLAWKLLHSRSKLFRGLLMALMVVEGLAIDFRLVGFIYPRIALSEKAELAEFLAQQQKPFRIYAHSYILPQHTAALYGLEMANGVDPLHLKAYALFMEEATGVPYKHYEVMVPHLLGDNPFTANKGYMPDPRKLGLLNVHYVISSFPLNVEGLEEIASFGEVKVYENAYTMPRAWIQASSGIRPVDYWEWSPNRLRIKARGPGLMVVSEIFYPGWEAFVDGKKQPIMTVERILRGLYLEEGEHEVEMRFNPLSLKAGLAGFALGLCLFVVSEICVFGSSVLKCAALCKGGEVR